MSDVERRKAAFLEQVGEEYHDISAGVARNRIEARAVVLDAARDAESDDGREQRACD